MWMSPRVVWMVAAVARVVCRGLARAWFEEAMVCTSRVGRSLKMSRSPDLLSLDDTYEDVA